MNFLRLLTSLLFISTTITAQEYPKSGSADPEWSLRISPLGLLDPFDLNLTMGGEYHFRPHWAVTTDISLIPASAYYGHVKWTSGYIIKPALRYYPSKGKAYFEADVFYKHVNYHMEDWLQKEVINGVAAYEQYQRFTIRKQVYGFNLKAGFRNYISRNRKFALEGFLGLGIRHRKQELRNEPHSLYTLHWRLLNNSSEENIFTHSVPMGLRFVYFISEAGG